MASTSSGTGSVIGAVISRMRRRVSCSLATFRSRLSLKSTSPPAYNVFSVSAAAEFFTRQTVRLLTLLACGRVYLTVLVRPSVRLSVPSIESTAAAACGGFTILDPARKRYRLIAARPSLSSNCEQCHVVN